MRRNALGFAVVCFGFLFAVAPVLAHHSFAAEYDSTQPIKFTGTVTKVEWMNPHIYYYVDVKDEAGKITNYAVEGGTPNSLRRQGWGKDSLKKPTTPPPSKFERIRDDLYVILGEGGNTTVLLTDEGVILVDDKFERNYADIVAMVKSLSNKPIKYVINTHAHGDHSGGNQKFLSSAQIIGHNRRVEMSQSSM